jgi:hypothetical protein
MESLIKKLILLKTNPKLVETLPQAEIIEMMETLIRAFRALQVSIEQNKLKGEAGYTPLAGKDYYSKDQTEEMVSTTLRYQVRKFEKATKELEDTVQKRLKDIRNGIDAEITEDHIQKAAQLASELIELPDFASLIQMEPQAIRDSLELLQDEERLDRKAVKGIDELERGLQQEIGAIRRDGGGGVKRLKNLHDVDTTGSNQNATIQYQTATGKWLTGVSITVSATAPTDPKFGDLWIALPG